MVGLGLLQKHFNKNLKDTYISAPMGSSRIVFAIMLSKPPDTVELQLLLFYITT
jgi:hypothetical protein